MLQVVVLKVVVIMFWKRFRLLGMSLLVMRLLTKITL